MERLEETIERFRAKEAGELGGSPLLFGGTEWIAHLERESREIDDEVIRHFLDGIVASIKRSQAAHGTGIDRLLITDR